MKDGESIIQIGFLYESLATSAQGRTKNCMPFTVQCIQCTSCVYEALIITLEIVFCEYIEFGTQSISNREHVQFFFVSEYIEKLLVLMTR